MFGFGQKRLDIRRKKQPRNKETISSKKRKERGEKEEKKAQGRKLDYGAIGREIVADGRVRRGGVAAEGERERERRERRGGEWMRPTP